MAAVIPNPDSILAFADDKAFEKWLSHNHDKAREVFLRIYKKGSGVASVTHQEALDVALCWGWIDAIRKAYDDESFLQRFTPRGKKSIWSQINRDHVARLVAGKRMTPHGLRQVDAAKADGRWQAAYAGASTMVTPPELLTAIEASPKALAMYKTLDKTNLFALAFRLGNLKTAEGRAKRIAAFVAMLERGEALHPLRAKKAPAEREKKPPAVAKKTAAKAKKAVAPKRKSAGKNKT
ncbi:MAG: hypothetical protein RLZZ450_6009 [Pseudomonadota bacterium]|jgi:uncharacterized protein YdeI (YjbR/CyaY-like superfamily)